MSPWARIPQIGQGLPASSPWSCIALCLPRLIRKCHNRGKLAISQALWFGCHLGGRTTNCVGRTGRVFSDHLVDPAGVSWRLNVRHSAVSPMTGGLNRRPASCIGVILHVNDESRLGFAAFKAAHCML
jgi:hypothetical protein